MTTKDVIKSTSDWTVSICFVAFFILLIYFLHPIYKHELTIISEYLGVNNFGSMFILISLLFFMALIAKLYPGNKLKIFNKINFFILISLYLVALSVTISIFTATSMINQNKEFQFKEDLGFTMASPEKKIVFGQIVCKSNLYIMPVKNDNLNCDLFVENKYKNIILNEISFTKSYESQDFYSYIFDEKQMVHTKFTIQSPDSRDYTLFWYLNTNSTYYTNGNKGLKLEEPSIAVAEKNERQRVIYFLLTSAISFSVLGIFTGMNNFRQLWHNK